MLVNLYSLVFFAAVATVAPVYGMETEVIAMEQSPTVWYKQRSVHVAAAMTTAVALYAFAVRMDRVSSPALLAGIFFAKFAKDAATENKQENGDQPSNDNQIIGEIAKEDQNANVVKSDKIATGKTAESYQDQLEVMVAKAKEIAFGFKSQYVNHERSPEDFDVDFSDKY